MSSRPLAAAAALLCTVSLAAAADSVQVSRETTLSRDPEIAALRARADAAPADPCVRNELGVALAKRSYYAEAEDALRSSLELSPDAVVWFNLGSVQLLTKDYGDAKSSFKHALQIDPNYAVAHYSLGAAYDATHDADPAVEHYKRALELDPKLGDVATNPQLLNNNHLLTVRTLRYQDTVGALGLPLNLRCTPPPSPPPPAPAPAPPAPAPETPPAEPPAEPPPAKP